MKRFFAPVLLFFLCSPVAHAFDEQALSSLVRSFERSGIRVGVSVYSLSENREVFGYKSTVPLNPASNAKLITTTAALEKLGPSFIYKTQFLSDNPPSGKTIQNLYIAGSGDPRLVQEKLWETSEDIAAKVKVVQGDIIVDQSAFDKATYSDDFGDPLRAYTASATSVALNFNSCAVKIEQQGKVGLKVWIDPDSDYFTLKSSVGMGRRRGIYIRRQYVNGKEQVMVSGSYRGGGIAEFYKNVSNPSLYAGYTLKAYLEQQGVQVLGGVREGIAGGRNVVAELKSDPLAEILQDVNKKSNNFMAEMILKKLGLMFHGKPGSTANGIQVLNDYLTGLGIPSQEFHLENGSGLSRNTSVTPRLLTRLLAHAIRTSWGNDFLKSLAIAGKDGTLKRRFRHTPLEGRLYGKTGTLNNASSLSGFLPTSSGKKLIFSILVDGSGAGHSRSHEFQEKIALMLYKD